MKILVTGGAGFIGSHVVDIFIENGHEVIVVDNLSSGAESNLNPKATFHKMDIGSQEFYDLIVSQRPDVIDHHAAHINVGKSVEDPTFDAKNNIMATINMMEAAREAGSVKKVIFASTGGAMYGNKQTPFDETMMPQPLSPYGISKRSAELYLYFYFSQYSIPFVALRYANVYGPRQNPHGEAGVISIFLDKLNASQTPVIFGHGKQTRDYVYAGDVAKANLLALDTKEIGEFNIGTTIETDVNDIYSLVAKAYGTDVAAEHGPARPGEQKTSSLRYEKAKKVLGWEPSVSLEEGIKKTVEYFKTS